MNECWLDIIGIGEDGMGGLSAESLAILEKAEVILGGDRHHTLTDTIKAERIAWPSPFDAMIDVIKSYRGKRFVILVTGDPLWYSVGARILKSIPTEEIRFHPQLSAFQWAASRMGWSLADCEQVTVHGRPVEQIIPYFAPGIRLLVLTKDKTSPNDIAKLLVDRGFEKSRLTVLAALGGPDEQRFEGSAENWSPEVPDFHVLAVECIAGPNAKYFSRTGGLPDDAFEHDGQMTKRVVRAATISALQPYPDALLWDIGSGCGSIAIEWMRAARGAEAIGIEPDEKRREMSKHNAVSLGVPRLRIVDQDAPEGLEALPIPDAVFIGGGLTDEGVFDAAWAALRSGGRLVANAVTLESEAKLVRLHKDLGGTLDRISASEAIAVGRYHGMKPFMTVTQWTVVKS
jgi:precorrin-6Y C5,15-methyltransferase (decarboxylating)